MKSSIQPLEHSDRTTDVLVRLSKVYESIRTAGRLVHICAWCGKIKTQEGFWILPEHDYSQFNDVKLTHGICPECREKMTIDCAEYQFQKASNNIPAHAQIGVGSLSRCD